MHTNTAFEQVPRGEKMMKGEQEEEPARID